MASTRVSRQLGIRYPIIQGGMQWVGRAELAAAVSNAGALGIITALTQPSPEHLRREIERCQSLTDEPFGVNLTILPSIEPPPYMEYADAIVRGGVKVAETAGNNPRELVAYFKKHAIQVIHKCTTVRHALSSEKIGVDMVSIDGFECAGHPGEDDVPALVLIPIAAQALKIPIIASGGIADGRGMAAALVLGAEGVNMGTRFVCTKEAPVHENIKKGIVGSTERDTRLIFRTLHNTARVLKNAISEEVVAMERRPGGCAFADIKHLVVGTRGKAAWESGDINGGILTAGMAIGLIDDIPSCQELIERIIRDCAQRLHQAAACLDSDLR